jgi:prepilin-type N-terminal cleavage/methylation domain-containing protein
MPTEQELPVRRRGFSLLEVLVVVGLIALLGSLLVMAIGHMQMSGNRQKTKLIMQNLQAIFAEYDVNRRVPFGMGNFNNYVNLSMQAPTPGTPNKSDILDLISMNCPQNVTADYNTAAKMNGQWPTNPAAHADREGLSPYVNTNPNPPSPYRGPAVPMTRSFMAQALAATNSAAALGKFGSGLMTFTGYDPSYPNLLAFPVWSAVYATHKFQIGDVVADSDGSTTPAHFFIRTKIKLDNTGIPQLDGAADGPPNYYYWMPAVRVYDNQGNPYPPSSNPVVPPATPVVLDAWGNPIIFVPGGVLGANPNPSTNNSGWSLLPDGSIPDTSGGMISGSGSSAIKTQVNSPDYHPFFASAGPDGDFSKGDDNLYSFEK